MTIYKPADSDRPDAYWEKNRDIAIRTVMEEDFPLGERMQIGFESGATEEVLYGRNGPFPRPSAPSACYASVASTDPKGKRKASRYGGERRWK
jgi:hypothetical protein